MNAWAWSLLIGAVALVQALGETAAAYFIKWVSVEYPMRTTLARRGCVLTLAAINAFVGLSQQQSGSPASQPGWPSEINFSYTGWAVACFVLVYSILLEWSAEVPRISNAQLESLVEDTLE